MVTPIRIVLGFTAMLSLLTVFAMQRGPDADAAAAAENTERFNGAWKEIMPTAEDDVRVISLQKSGRDAVATEPKTVTVMTERITVQPVEKPSQPPPLNTAQNEEKPRRERAEWKPEKHSEKRRSGGNVCERHGMKKVVVRGGRGWRCRKTR